MEFNGLLGTFYKIGEWIIRLIYTNILWVIFTVLGFIVLGFMPSTIALFTVMRKWMFGQNDIPVFKTYWQTFKQEFVKSNLIGLVLVVLALVLYVDYQVILSVSSTFFQLLAITFLVVLVLFTLMCLYMFPVYVQYDMKFIQYFKLSFLFAFVSPLYTVLMIIALFFTGLLMVMVPGIIPLMGVSAIAAVVMSAANYAFIKVKEKGQQHQVNSG